MQVQVEDSEKYDLFQESHLLSPDIQMFFSLGILLVT